MDDFIINNDKTNIKRHIINTYSKKSIKHPKKSFSFYLSVIKLYPCYIDTFVKIINNITDWGYYKDLILLIIASKKENNLDTEQFIYQNIVNNLLIDIEKQKKDQPVSKLAKWLPREGSSFDNKIGFVDNIGEILFPKIKNKFTRREEYRKKVASLNKYIGTLEIFICSKEYDKIDLNIIPGAKLNRYFNKLITDLPTKNRIIEHLKQKYSQFNLIGLVSKCLYKKINEFEKDIINDIWKSDNDYLIEKFLNDNSLVNEIMESHDIVLDMSKNMFEGGLLKSIILLILTTLDLNKRIIINSYNPFEVNIDKNEKLTNIIDKIRDSASFNKEIKIDKIRDITKDKIIIITNKSLQVFDENTRICTLVQGKVYEKKRDKEIYKIGIIPKPINKRRKIFEIKRSSLIEILDNSEELKVNNTPFYIFITVMIMISVYLYFYNY
jgi:hypothetical protein